MPATLETPVARMERWLTPSRVSASSADVETLCEDIDVASSRVDTAAGIVRNVKILGRTSDNGREYTEAAIRNAVSLYERKQVNLDHPPRGKENTPRSYADRFGHLERVHATSEGLYGDLHYNLKHPRAEQFAYDAQHAPHRVGLSHNAEARTTRNGGRLVVEAIISVKSVDLVADPATTTGLFEGLNPGMSKDEQLAEMRQMILRMQAKIKKLKAEKGGGFKGKKLDHTKPASASASKTESLDPGESAVDRLARLQGKATATVTESQTETAAERMSRWQGK